MYYLELDELIVGKTYQCRTYDGNLIIDIYRGNGGFYSGLFIDEDIRYVMPEIFHFFWKETDEEETGFLSQWYKCDFQDENYIYYNSAEQYMMYQKAKLFKDEVIAEQILFENEPKIQKKLGRLISGFDEKIWNEKARDIVYRGNWYKFTQNQNLKERLFAFFEGSFCEASPYDTVWGVGLSVDDKRILNRENWLGKNWLGEVLDKLRSNLLNKTKIFDWS